MVIHQVTNFGKICQRGREEPAQPDALASAANPDAVHAIVPVVRAHQGNAMGPGGYPFGDGAAAMFIKRTDLSGRELPIALMFIGFQWFSTQEGNLLRQDGSISGHAHIMRSDIWQPEQIIRTACAQPAPSGGMPPVQHIPSSNW